MKNFWFTLLLLLFGSVLMYQNANASQVDLVNDGADSCVEITGGPWVAAGSWPALSQSYTNPTRLTQNVNVLWTFSNDYGCCNNDPTHKANYKKFPYGNTINLPVVADADQGYAYTELPIENLQNGSTYSFSFQIKDCAGQTKESPTYFFVVVIDKPPVITGGPWVAAGGWPMLSRQYTNPTTLRQNVNVLWTFSDDYGICENDPTHTASYIKIPNGERKNLPVVADADQGSAYTGLPIKNLQIGELYMFTFAIRDCAGQTTSSSSYFFKVLP